MAFDPLALSSVKPVCKPDCPGRSWDCHGKCEKYKTYRAACDAEMEDRFQKKEFERDVNTAALKAVKRLPGKRRI